MLRTNMLLFLILQIFFAVTQGKGILSGSEKLCRGDKGVMSQDQILTEEKVKFQFYYETECPFSIYIYILELNNTVLELAPYVDIATYPYGNANMKLNGTQLTIECQHDEEECYGNMLHACSIDALTDPTKYVPFNSCMMLHVYDMDMSNDNAADECGKKLKVDSKSIKECAKSIRGFELLLHYGIESGKVKYRGVPWWYINGVSKTSGEERPLKELLCAAFKNPPAVCNS